MVVSALWSCVWLWGLNHVVRSCSLIPAGVSWAWRRSASGWWSLCRLWLTGLRRTRLRAINSRPARPQQPSVQKRLQHPSLRHHVHPRRRENRRHPARQIPAGWHSIGIHRYHWVTRFFGPGATLERHDIQADHPSPGWDELGRPREVVIDTLTVTQSVALEVYPPTVLYELASIPRISDPQPVRITPQLTANLYSIVDDQLLLTWTALTWTWRTPTATQRITMIAVDNHEPGAPFPAPANALISNLNTLATIPQSPQWARKYSSAAWSHVLAKPAAHGWSVCRVRGWPVRRCSHYC